MDNLLAIILKDTYSLTQLKHRLRLLKTYLLHVFFGGEAISFSPPELNWLKSLPNTFYHQFTKDNVYQIFTDFDNAVKKFNTLTMYLTFEPDDATLTQIGTYVRNNFKQNLLLDIKLDPNLIAGTALSWKGNYKDYSLRAKIGEKRGEMFAEFKKFLR